MLLPPLSVTVLEVTFLAQGLFIIVRYRFALSTLGHLLTALAVVCGGLAILQSLAIVGTVTIPKPLQATAYFGMLVVAPWALLLWTSPRVMLREYSGWFRFARRDHRRK